MESKFKIGDVVRLKSWSPNLTVGSILANGSIRVGYWYEGAIKDAFVMEDMIEKANDGPGITSVSVKKS